MHIDDAFCKEGFSYIWVCYSLLFLSKSYTVGILLFVGHHQWKSWKCVSSLCISCLSFCRVTNNLIINNYRLPIFIPMCDLKNGERSFTFLSPPILTSYSLRKKGALEPLVISVLWWGGSNIGEKAKIWRVLTNNWRVFSLIKSNREFEAMRTFSELNLKIYIHFFYRLGFLATNVNYKWISLLSCGYWFSKVASCFNVKALGVPHRIKMKLFSLQRCHFYEGKGTEYESIIVNGCIV